MGEEEENLKFKSWCIFSLTRPLSLVEHIGMGLALGVACEPLEGACDDIPKKFWEFPTLSPRLQHSPYFCVFSQKKVWNEAENRERDWRETLKNTDCPFCIRYIRSNYPHLPATGNSHWLNFDASCQQTVK